MSTGKKVDYTYDGLNRLTKTSLTTSADKPIDTTYTYFASKRGSGYTTTKLKSETINGEKYEYKYDARSNITDVTKDGVLQYHYDYDMMNQLVSVDDKLNGKVYNYTYDAGGNLISETVTDSNGTTSNAYEYNNSNWGDVLTSYNGQNITYDEIGNPLTYRDGMSMTWKNGRQLATLTNGDTSISYGYDSDSVRTTKTVNGVKYTYAYLNGQLLYETRGDAKFYYSYDANGNPLSYRDGMSFEWENGRILKKINTSDSSIQMSYDSNGMRTQKTVGGVKTNYYYDSDKNLIALVKGNDTLLFYYDSDGSATSFSYNGTMYFYVKNLQGDVIRIIDLAGTEVASYVYDAWGNIKDTNGEPTIREINPIRYRGYVYDTETSLYYLQSRYYDPFTGRFLNADDTAFIGVSGTVLSGNLFAYCENNPVNHIDNYGYVKINIKWLSYAVDAILWLIPALYAVSKIWKSVSKTASKLVSFGKKLISVGKTLFKRLDNRLYCAFAKESTYRIVKTIGKLAGIISIISSPGSIVQYLIDILDGKWDGYLNTSHIKPKFDLKKRY